MANLTEKESEVLLKLFKDFSQDYNANSISKHIKITPRGALKILKNLEKEKIVIGRKLGKAVFYKPNLNDMYAAKTIETLLIKETRDKATRWLHEFEGLFRYTEIVLLFGSILKNPTHANDIDILLVFKKKNYEKVSAFINEKNKMLLKKIHSIPQTMKDLKENLKKNDAIKDAIRTGYVLQGFDKLIGVIKDVTSL
jgi:predicted nucleotidyltransferase